MSEKFLPLKESTQVSENGHEWRPATFADFLEELLHLEWVFNEVCFFRGHRQNNWLLDSTFARNLKIQRGLSVTQRYSEKLLNDVSEQHEMARAWLRKFRALHLSPQLQQYKSLGIDPYYEHHRHHQQNPNNPLLADIPPVGTNFIDFTWNWKVGLFFANFKRAPEMEGALFIIRQTALGNVLFREGNSVLNLMQILEKWLLEKPEEEYGRLPLMIDPEKQLNSMLDPKIKRQEALYLMQTDFRVDCGLSWELLHGQTGKQVFVKLILPADTQTEVQEVLSGYGISKDYLFPATAFD